MSVFLSSDFKNTVSLEGTPAEIAENIATAKSLFQKIIGEYGTKPTSGHISPPTTNQTVFTPDTSTQKPNNGHSNNYSKQNNCSHNGGTTIKTSHSEKNPNREFIACKLCGKYERWVD